MDPVDIHKELNPAQRSAVMSVDGALLIVAGAGAGKTKTIVHRILEIISRGADPESILAVTFTNKAAREMRERVLGKLPAGSHSPVLLTFHSFGVSVMREFGAKLGYNRHFSILDADDQLSLIKEILKELDIDPKEHDPRSIRERISRAKNSMISVFDYGGSARTPREKITAMVWDRYAQAVKKRNAVDFDDLLLLPLALFEKFPEVLEIYQKRFQYIHIDEYQDTNQAQYQLARMLSDGHGNICVVGDADQTIYTWRGAQIENILRFEKDFPGATVVILEENYRSSARILEAANEVIKKNRLRTEKNLFTKAPDGETITTFEGYDERHEAAFIAERAREAIALGTPPTEIAVLYRTNFQSRAIEEAMIALDVPYTVLGVRFFERREVRDLLSYIRAALNRDSVEDIKRSINTPARGIGKTTLTKLLGNLDDIPAKTIIKINQYYQILDEIKQAVLTQKPSEGVKFALKRSGLEKTLSEGASDDVERLMNLEELVTLATRYDDMPGEDGIELFLADAALETDTEAKGEKKEGVRMMTVHSAKGLEFDIVFIAGVEDGLFPLRRDDHKLRDDEAEEERRLMYVAITRAKRKLYITHAMFRTIYGNKDLCSPSEFLFDIPAPLITKESGGGGNFKESSEKVIYFDI